MIWLNRNFFFTHLVPFNLSVVNINYPVFSWFWVIFVFYFNAYQFLNVVTKPFFFLAEFWYKIRIKNFGMNPIKEQKVHQHRQRQFFVLSLIFEIDWLSWSLNYFNTVLYLLLYLCYLWVPSIIYYFLACSTAHNKYYHFHLKNFILQDFFKVKRESFNKFVNSW